MNIYLKSIVKDLRNHTASIEKGNLLIDKPWASIDEEQEMLKLIFKKNKELILSKNGQVQIGKWDYFPEAKSLLIDRNTDKILCNEAFIDKGVMVLRLDGTDNRFFILANENIIPDLDANRYLKELRHQTLKIVESKLADGRILEIHRNEQYERAEVGNHVTVDAEILEDGKYQLAKVEKYIEVRDGMIYKILTETTYINPDNVEIKIQQADNYKVKSGDEVFMSGKLVGSMVINFSKNRNLVVKKGKVVRFESKNAIAKFTSKLWNQIWGNYNN